jgi:hypothetical protein
MTKKTLEVYVVFGEHPNSALAVKIWMEAKGDLYVTNHGQPLAGKYSYHQSGMDHQLTELTGRRSGVGKPLRKKLRGLKGYEQVTALSSPGPLEPTGYVPKRESRVRRTLWAPMPAIGWYFTLWAIEAGKRDLAIRICETDPWPAVPIRATLLADWTEPWFLVTIGYWASERPYRVIRYEPRLPGRVPFEIVPRSYEGTWLEHPGPRWRPGEPFPDEWIREAFEGRDRK